MYKEQKKAIRKEIKKKIQALHATDKENQRRIVSEKLQKLPQFKNAETIMLFWSMDDEICTHPLIEAIGDSKQILLPVIENDLLIVKLFQGKEMLVADNPFRIGEPIGQTIMNPQPDLVIMPGLAFDEKCNRLGRGKGYYDKFLSTGNFSAPLIAIAYNEQIVASIPTEPHDVPIDGIITAEKSYFKTEELTN